MFNNIYDHPINASMKISLEPFCDWIKSSVTWKNSHNCFAYTLPRYDLNNIQSNQDNIVALFYNAYCKRSQNTYVPLVFYMRLLTKYGELT